LGLKGMGDVVVWNVVVVGNVCGLWVRHDRRGDRGRKKGKRWQGEGKTTTWDWPYILPDAKVWGPHLGYAPFLSVFIGSFSGLFWFYWFNDPRTLSTTCLGPTAEQSSQQRQRWREKIGFSPKSHVAANRWGLISVLASSVLVSVFSLTVRLHSAFHNRRGRPQIEENSRRRNSFDLFICVVAFPASSL
jgi:hypothetical protein